MDSMDSEIKEFFKDLSNIEENLEKWKNVWIIECFMLEFIFGFMFGVF